MKTLFDWIDKNGNKVLSVICVALFTMQGQQMIPEKWAILGLAVLNAIIDQSYRGGKKKL